MSVSQVFFWQKLVALLPEIADADYVAVDFEMTGIDARRPSPLQRPTMDQLYECAKKAAETFNVLQFGLTCIAYEASTNTFRAKSYNFNVSPLFDTNARGGAVLARLLDRTLTLSYKTLLFLRQNRIFLEDAYDGGIMYLSRAEEADITPALFGPDWRSDTDRIDIDSQQTETQQFCAEVTSKIRAWEDDAGRVRSARAQRRAGREADGDRSRNTSTSATPTTDP